MIKQLSEDLLVGDVARVSPHDQSKTAESEIIKRQIQLYLKVNREDWHEEARGLIAVASQLAGYVLVPHVCQRWPEWPYTRMCKLALRAMSQLSLML
eukprot:3065406-Amphidinium_carterae.2